MRTEWFPEQISPVEPNPRIAEEGARAFIDELGRWCLADLLELEKLQKSPRLRDVLDPRD